MPLFFELNSPTAPYPPGGSEGTCVEGSREWWTAWRAVQSRPLLPDFYTPAPCLLLESSLTKNWPITWLLFLFFLELHAEAISNDSFLDVCNRPFEALNYTRHLCEPAYCTLVAQFSGSQTVVLQRERNSNLLLPGISGQIFLFFLQ